MEQLGIVWMSLDLHGSACFLIAYVITTANEDTQTGSSIDFTARDSTAEGGWKS